MVEEFKVSNSLALCRFDQSATVLSSNFSQQFFGCQKNATLTLLAAFSNNETKGFVAGSAK